MADAERVRDLAELCQVRLFKVELSAALEADGVDDEVGVDMRPVRVGGHEDLVALPLLRQLQCDPVRQLRRDGLLRMEGLDEVIVHATAVFSVLQLGAEDGDGGPGVQPDLQPAEGPEAARPDHRGRVEPAGGAGPGAEGRVHGPADDQGSVCEETQ